MSVDADALGWATAVHDAQRWDDGIDPDHGARAADWIDTNRRLLPQPSIMAGYRRFCPLRAQFSGTTPASPNDVALQKHIRNRPGGLKNAAFAIRTGR